MNEATDLDAEYGGRTAAPSQLHAAADDIGGIGSGRDVQQQAGDDEEPKFVNAEHDFRPCRCNLALTLSSAASGCHYPKSFQHEAVAPLENAARRPCRSERSLAFHLDVAQLGAVTASVLQ